MRRRMTALLGALVPAMAALAGCDGEDGGSSPGTPPAAADQAATPGEQTAPGQDTDSYLDRLTPVAKVRKALDIKVEGKDAWVTVPAESTAASAILECLQMLPAVQPDETLTVIYSDGVEELCEWPEDD